MDLADLILLLVFIGFPLLQFVRRFNNIADDWAIAGRQKIEDLPGEILVAVKIWQVLDGEDVGKWRATLYYRDAIEKWITADKSDTMPEKGDDFILWTPTDGTQNPLEGTFADGLFQAQYRF